MQRTDFQTTQAYIENLVEVNRQMEENQQQMTPVIQGLMDKVSLLTTENEQLKTLLEQSINELEELKRAKEEKMQIENEYETIKHENGRMKEDNDQKITEIKTLQQKVYLVEQSYSCQLDDLKIQLTRKEEIIGNMKEQYELLNEEVQMGRKQIQILVDELEKQRNESGMKNVMQENIDRMNELNGLFNQFKEFFSGNGSIGNFHLCCNDNYGNEENWNSGINIQMNDSIINQNNLNQSDSSTETGEPSQMIEEPNEVHNQYEENSHLNNVNNQLEQHNEEKMIEKKIENEFIEEINEEMNQMNEIQEENQFNQIKEMKEIKENNQQNEMFVEKSDIDGMQIENPLSEILLQPIGIDQGKEMKNIDDDKTTSTIYQSRISEINNNQNHCTNFNQFNHNQNNNLNNNLNNLNNINTHVNNFNQINQQSMKYKSERKEMKSSEEKERREIKEMNTTRSSKYIKKPHIDQYEMKQTNPKYQINENINNQQKKESRKRHTYSLQKEQPKVVFLSGLSRETKELLTRKLKSKEITIQNQYTQAVTHVVVSSKLTLTSFRALVEGKWVVNKNWILNGIQNDEVRYGFKRMNLFTNKSVYFSDAFLADQSANEIANVLIRYAHVIMAPNPKQAHLCLIGKDEILSGQNVYTKDTFLKHLPLPKSVLFPASIPRKVSLMKTPVTN